ncbi:MAG: hypothetical protein ACP5N3_00800 [Candidatus Nanoarchaeia archaeon]
MNMAGEPFIFWNGRTAFDAESLKICISEIPHDEFFSYVNGKNDFANWLEGSLQEKELADRVRSLSERDLIVAVLSDFIEKRNAKLLIGTRGSFNEDALIREVLEKNEKFLGTDKQDSKETEKMEEKTESIETKTAENKESSPVKEKGSTITLVDLPKRKHSLDKEFFIGITFGMIIGILLTLIMYKLFVLG